MAKTSSESKKNQDQRNEIVYGPFQGWQKGLYSNFAMLMEQFLAEMEKANMPMRFTAGIRTAEQQEKLYEQGRAHPGKIVTNARAWETSHNYGLAVDVCFRGKDPYAELSPKSWETVAILCEKFGLEWGGSWKKFPDKPHIQCLYGFTVKELKAIIDKGGDMLAVWSAIDIKRADKG